MSAQPVLWKQTRSGRAFPLCSFSAEDIDLFGDVSEALARICRFGGHVSGNAYSVAQHCTLGADAAMDETEDPALAAYVLLHDAHEYVLGDITTPVTRWLSEIERQVFGSQDVARTLIDTAKQRLDEAIWRAAGLPRPNQMQRAAIKAYDLRLLATEQRQLLAPTPLSWGWDIDNAKPIRMRGRLTAWPVARAVQEYRARLDQLCPKARRV